MVTRSFDYIFFTSWNKELGSYKALMQSVINIKSFMAVLPFCLSKVVLIIMNDFSDKEAKRGGNHLYFYS